MLLELVKFFGVGGIFFIIFWILSSRYKIFRAEKMGCIVPGLLGTLAVMFLRTRLLYSMSSKPLVFLYAFIAACIFFVGYIVYLYISGDEEIHKIVDKIKTSFKK